MSVRAAVRRLERTLRPAGLTLRWFTALQATEGILRRLDTGHRPASEQSLRESSRLAAAGGREPGDVLASILSNRPGA